MRKFTLLIGFLLVTGIAYAQSVIKDDVLYEVYSSDDYYAMATIQGETGTDVVVDETVTIEDYDYTVIAVSNVKNENVINITLPTSITEVFFNMDGMPNLESFIMDSGSEIASVRSGMLYFENYIYIPRAIKHITFMGASCSIVGLPKLEHVSYGSGLTQINISDCPALKTLVIGKDISSINIENTYNIESISLREENTNFKINNGGALVDTDNRIVYLPANITSYNIPVEEPLETYLYSYEQEYVKWPYLQTLTMDSRDDGFMVEDNVLYLYYYGNKWAVDAAGGLTELKLASDIYNLITDYYDKCLFHNKIQNLESITVADGCETFKVINNVLCKVEYLSDWEYILKTILAPTKVSGELYLSDHVEEPSEGLYYSGIKIGKYTFENCDNITSVVLSEEITSIDYAAFMNCDNLEKVVFNGGYCKIGGMAFYDCVKLNDITFPLYDTNLEDASALSYTKWAENQSGDVRYAGTALYYVKRGVETLDIPEGITCVAGQSLSNNSDNIKSLILPESLCHYHQEEGLSNLETLTIKSGYVEYTSRPFTSCYNLQKVTVTSDYPQYFEEDREYTIFPSDLSKVQLIVPDDYTYINEYEDKDGSFVSETVEVTPAKWYAESYEWRRFGEGIVTGVENIEQTIAEDDANAEYYTLQGLKVTKENLTQGVYIKKSAGKAVKVLVK